MTPNQRTLARHALGLPNRQRRSYRNQFVASYAPYPDFNEWRKMENAGYAQRAKTMTGTGDSKRVRFWLTEKGARAALDKGETLCPEDFPKQKSK